MHIELLLNIIVIDLLHLLLHITHYEEYCYYIKNKYILNIIDLFYCSYVLLFVFNKRSDTCTETK